MLLVQSQQGEILGQKFLRVSHSGRTVENTESLNEIIFASKNFCGFTRSHEMREATSAPVNVGVGGDDQGVGKKVEMLIANVSNKLFTPPRGRLRDESLRLARK